MKKISTSQAAWALLTEGVTNARIEAHRLRHLLQRAQKLVEGSPRRDHLYEVAGDLIMAAPDRLSAIEKSLDRTGYALAHMGQDFLKGRLGVTDRQMVEDTIAPSGQFKESLGTSDCRVASASRVAARHQMLRGQK